jgi:hypothetical protein
MKNKWFSFAGAISALMLAACGCSVTTVVVTQNEISTAPGLVTVLTQSFPGHVTPTTLTTSQTFTQTAVLTTALSGPVYWTTLPGTTVTAIQTKTAVSSSPLTNGVTGASFTPLSPATLHFNEYVTVTLDYMITDPNGCRIWAMPLTAGYMTPHYVYQPSGTVPAGKGSITRWFTVSSVPVKVDQIYIAVDNAAGVEVFQLYLPVSYSYTA